MGSQYSLRARKASKIPGWVREGTESEKAKSCTVVSLHKPMVCPEKILERLLGMDKFGENDWRFNKWDGCCVKINKTCGLAKTTLYSVLLLVAKAGSTWPGSFGVLALLVSNYLFM